MSRAGTAAQHDNHSCMTRACCGPKSPSCRSSEQRDRWRNLCPHCGQICSVTSATARTRCVTSSTARIIRSFAQISGATLVSSSFSTRCVMLMFAFFGAWLQPAGRPVRSSRLLHVHVRWPPRGRPVSDSHSYKLSRRFTGADTSFPSRFGTTSLQSTPLWSS